MKGTGEYGSENGGQKLNCVNILYEWMAAISLLLDVGVNGPIFAHRHAYLASCQLTQVDGKGLTGGLKSGMVTDRYHFPDEAEGSPYPGSGSTEMALAQTRRTCLSSYVGRS